MPEQVPSVGRVVHLVTNALTHRPALIVDPGDGSTIALIGFVLPGEGPQGSMGWWFLDACPYDASGVLPASWHWPEYVPPQDAP